MAAVDLGKMLFRQMSCNGWISADDLQPSTHSASAPDTGSDTLVVSSGPFPSSPKEKAGFHPVEGANWVNTCRER